MDVKQQVIEYQSMIYVTTTDKLMSGWGKAGNRINRLVFHCYSFEEADIVAGNAKEQGQKYVRQTQTFPKYNVLRNFVQHKTKLEYPNWYIKDYFRNQKT
jgi:hypothetical protein